MNIAYHIVLADDHPRFRHEVRKLVEAIPGVRVAAEVGGGHELYDLLERLAPDMILLDISMPDLRGIKATKEIKSRYPKVKVIIMAMDGEEEYQSHAISAGADGILLKQNCSMDLEKAIQEIRIGKRYFLRSAEAGVIRGNPVRANFFDCLMSGILC